MQILFSDLGRMLIDPETLDAVVPVLERIREKCVPLILITNKTRAEVEFWRNTTGIRYPFVVEGGGAVFFPKNHMALPFLTKDKDGYDVVELGTPSEELIVDLNTACEMSGCMVRGFNQMSIGEVSLDSGLSTLQADFAKQREYSEAFHIVHGDPSRLGAAIQRLGRRFTQRDGYCYISGNNHVSAAIRVVSHTLTLSYGPVTKVGLGIPSDHIPFLKDMDRVILATPASWSDAALTFLQE